jgi:hypothetical protein
MRIAIVESVFTCSKKFYCYNSMPPNLHRMKNNSWWKLSTTCHEGNLIISLQENFQDHWKVRNLKQQKLKGHLGLKKKLKKQKFQDHVRAKKIQRTHILIQTHFHSQAHTFLCKHTFKCTHFHANMFIKKIDYLSWRKNEHHKCAIFSRAPYSSKFFVHIGGDNIKWANLS